jgi:16S rRNA (cytosine967-C5)-methyltransferase
VKSKAPSNSASRWAPGASALADSATALCTIAFEGRSADDALAAFDNSDNRSAVRAIALGSVRWYLRLAPAIDALLTRPRGLTKEIRALLIVSAHQIVYSRNVPQATVHAAVDAARILGKGSATGLVNAVLRKFVSGRESLLAKVDEALSSRTAHPAWLVDAIRAAWPQQYDGILEANNGHPPMVLRVNLARRSRSDYLADLAAAGVGALPVAWLDGAVQLDRPVAVSALPGFQDGFVSVQDGGAQLAATLLALQPGMRVLDACAAPGGKTGHILERAAALAGSGSASSAVDVTAVDIDPQRIEQIDRNLERLRLKARACVADVRDPASFWDGRPFDRILVDAPCSSTGVIRRHPDIKLLRRPGDVGQFAKIQMDILKAAFAMLAADGRLVYATCSVLPPENEAIVSGFLAAEPSAQLTSTHAGALAPGALDVSLGVQLLPGAEAGTDGFYYACLEKTTRGT